MNLKSRKFWVAVIGAVVVFLKGIGIFSVNDETTWQFIVVILTWIGVEGAVDLAKAWRNYTVTVEEQTTETNN